MTNEELIKRFFSGRCSGREESYGFLIKVDVASEVGLCKLRSKQYGSYLAEEVKRNIFLIATHSIDLLGGQFQQHFNLVIETATNMKVTFFQAPLVDKNQFHKHMEGEINLRLRCLAKDLKTGDYKRVCLNANKFKCTPGEPTNSASAPRNFDVGPENYQKLMLDFKVLLDGERLMGLPKKRIQLLDTEEVCNAWCWLIKKSPVKKDREFLRDQYMKSKMLGSKRD